MRPIHKDEYTIRRFGAVSTDTGKYKKRWLKKAFSTGEVVFVIPRHI